MSSRSLDRNGLSEFAFTKLTNKERAEYVQAVRCSKGHRLRYGPWDLRICDHCTADFLEGYKAQKV
jgi:hypothetical protein